MNTKDYIETKKSRKLSNILKGVLATGIVVGSMVTSTACKPNQPHESSSSTSTIETTTTTTPVIEDPKEIISKKQKSLLNTIDLCEEQLKKEYEEMPEYIEFVLGYDKFIFLNRVISDSGKENNYIVLASNDLENRESHEIFSTKLSQEDYNYLADKFGIVDDKAASFFIHPIIRFSDDYSGDYEYILESTKNINEINDEKVLDIILDSFSKSLSQDQQDDLVR